MSIKDIWNSDTYNDLRNKHLIFVGHSLGGALATIGACYFSHLYPYEFIIFINFIIQC